MLTIALSHLLGRGVRLTASEAVALARELLAQPSGVPAADNIQIGSDGSASCTSTNGVPSVASVAELLQTLLPAGTPDVPAPLRYAIARARRAVEAPPFASPDEFAAALARFERGARRDVLKGLLQRGARPSRAVPPAVAVTAVAGPAPGSSSHAPRPSNVVGPRASVGTPQRAVPAREQPAAVAPAAPIFRTVSAGRRLGSAERSPRWFALTAAAALAVSFGVGFSLADRISERPATTKADGADHRGPSSSAATLPAYDSPSRSSEVKLEDEIVRLPPMADRGSVRQNAGERSDAPADEPAGRIDGADDHVRVVRAVRSADANAFSPSFASDGTAIFFHTGTDRDSRSAIEVATAGSRPAGETDLRTIVDDGARNYHAQPSPDGRFVAFDSDRDGERGIYVANRDGSDIHRVSGAGYAAVPTWSRDSEWLAYVRAEPDRPAVWNLWIQPAHGGSARRVTTYRYGQTWAASWFPDNRRIAYSHENALLVMDLQTGQSTRYRTPVKGELVRTPAVSPDGTKIIFQVFHHGAWLLDLANGSMHRVLADPTAEEFAWSPDGSRVAFHSRRGGRWGIYVLSRT
jgi:hypothetical protein